MNTKRKDTAERLDAALSSGQHCEPELTGLLTAARQLEILRPTPPLSQKDLDAARQAFLAQAEPKRASLPVAAEERQGWFARLKNAFQPPQARSLVPTLAALILLIGMALAVGFGLPRLNQTAQGSLPGDRLYTYKLQRENLNTRLTFDRFQRALLFVELVEIRNQEIASLTQQGQVTPDKTLARLEAHLQTALRMASQLPDEQMRHVLEAVRYASLNASDILKQADQWVQDANGRAQLNQAAAAASDTLVLADQGLQDPGSFRNFMAAPPSDRPKAPTPTDWVVYPPVEPTPVVILPSPTLGVFIPPIQEPTPSVPTRTPAEPTQHIVQPTRTPTDAPTRVPTATDPPPVLPTATDIFVVPTQAPTITLTPTPTETPEDGPLFPTPTPAARD